MSLTEEQLQKRLNYVTGSDCSTICGVNPYGNIVELWQQKLGLAVSEDISHKPAVRAGNYLEPVVAQWFSDETGKELAIEPDMLIHKTVPFMAGNIDRRVIGESAILECKTTSREDGWGDPGENIIPDHYLCQVAHYVAVCDVERAYIAVLIRGTDFRWYTYERNPTLEAMIIQKETDFWDCVQKEIPPIPRNLNEVVSLYSEAQTSEPLIASTEIEELVENLKLTKEFVKEKQEHQKRLETAIKVYMKNHDTLYDVRGKPVCTWKNTNAIRRFDANAFETDNPLLYMQYMKTAAGFRRFVVK